MGDLVLLTSFQEIQADLKGVFTYRKNTKVGDLVLLTSFQEIQADLKGVFTYRKNTKVGDLVLLTRFQEIQADLKGVFTYRKNTKVGDLVLLTSFQEIQADLKGVFTYRENTKVGDLVLLTSFQEIQADLKGVFTYRENTKVGDLVLQTSFEEIQADLKGGLHLQGNNQSGRSSAPDQLRGNSGGPQGSLHLRTDQECDQDTGGHASYMSARTSGAIASGLTYEPKEGPTSTTDDSNVQPKASTSTATGTPSQWLGGTSPTDPMSLLAGGIAQLQAAMLTQLKDKEKDKPKEEDCSPETVKPGSSSLPSLPEVDPATSSVDVMDWLEVITTTMQDLSDGSAAWWIRVPRFGG